MTYLSLLRIELAIKREYFNLTSKGKPLKIYSFKYKVIIKMKTKIYILLAFIFCISIATKADTIDTWKVYYNGIEVHLLNLKNAVYKPMLQLSINTIEAGDSITVIYSTDTPCSICSFSLIVEDENRQVVLIKKVIGEQLPISFLIKDLLDYKERGGQSIYKIFHTSNKGMDRKVYEKVLFSLLLK